MIIKARIIAFYLPQFHPIPENDEWWGKGFTEWTNVGKAKPLFRGHYQPRVPADLGYYDLRIPEVREQQADLAREAGIEGFCYWHYWFGNGRRILEMPFHEVLTTGKPDYPFCLGWANHTWSRKTWLNGTKKGNEDLLIQTYPGDEDYVLHFNAILPALKDHRYMQIDGRPIFLVYNPSDIPDANHMFDLWNKLAKENGFENGMFFVGQKGGHYKDFDQVLMSGFDAVNTSNSILAQEKLDGKIMANIKAKLSHLFPSLFPKKFDYGDIMDNWFTEYDKRLNAFPSILPNYDRSPRGGKAALIYHNSTPEKFKKHAKEAIELVKDKPFDHRVIFLRAWNEWGEGSYMEPDLKFGKGYIEALKEVVFE